MCTRVGTRPCPVCRSLGWRPPQRGKRRPRPPTHGQLPSLLLKPKNLKKSGPGFIRGRVERAGPKRSRRSAALTSLRQSWNLFLTFYVRPIRKPVTPPSKTAQDVGTPDGPHCGRGTGAVGPAGPSLQTPTLPRLSPRRSGRKDAPGCRPRRPPLLLRLRGTASSFVPPGPGGPGPGLSSRPSCPLLPRLLQAKPPRRRFSHVPHRVPPRRPLQGLAPAGARRAQTPARLPPPPQGSLECHVPGQHPPHTETERESVSLGEVGRCFSRIKNGFSLAMGK